MTSFSLVLFVASRLPLVTVVEPVDGISGIDLWRAIH
jgi:hypothetical protein